jgi:hypothetical protein
LQQPAGGDSQEADGLLVPSLQLFKLHEVCLGPMCSTPAWPPGMMQRRGSRNDGLAGQKSRCLVCSLRPSGPYKLYPRAFCCEPPRPQVLRCFQAKTSPRRGVPSDLSASANVCPWAVALRAGSCSQQWPFVKHALARFRRANFSHSVKSRELGMKRPCLMTSKGVTKTTEYPYKSETLHEPLLFQLPQRLQFFCLAQFFTTGFRHSIYYTEACMKR